MQKLEINYINHGIACRIGNKVYLNTRLKALPELHTAILTHEKEHSDGFLWKDLIMDINNQHIKPVKKEYYKFILANPSSWTEFLPFWFYDKKFVFNPLIAFIYFFSIVFGRWIWIRI